MDEQQQPEQPIVNEQTPVNEVNSQTTPEPLVMQPNKPMSTSAILFRVFSVIGIVFGIIAGFFIGAIIQFGSCLKSQCSPLEQSAPLIIPAASLLVTVPLTVKAFKKK